MTRRLTKIGRLIVLKLQKPRRSASDVVKKSMMPQTSTMVPAKYLQKLANCLAKTLETVNQVKAE